MARRQTPRVQAGAAWPRAGWAAGCALLCTALASPSDATPRLRAETGFGYDTNITRAETRDARRGGSLLRAVLDVEDSARLSQAVGAGVSYQGGAKHFIDVPDEDVAFQRLAGRLMGRLAPGYVLTAQLAVHDRTSRDPARPRDYTRLSGGPSLSVRLGPVALGARAGVERLLFKSDDRFSATAFSTALTAAVGEGAWAADAHAGVQRRAFDGARLVRLGPDDPVPADGVRFLDPSGREIGADPRGVARTDHVWSAGARVRYTGAWLMALEYGLAIDDSDSFNGSFVRHEVQASATVPVMFGVLLSAKASLQRLAYADRVYLSPLEYLDDENRTSITGRLEWPVFDQVSLVGSGGAWFSPIGTGTEFERYGALLGVALHDG